MKNVYGYIRVSTTKQGAKGVSLTEQKDAIERYANHHQLTIIEWFEEQETAAKRGRRVFKKMLNQLEAGLAIGVVIHKIDRSARNLRDWAELVDLADRGTEVHFVNESIDMGVRGGRLSADIQAVVAADYVRNLREETLKGIRGRLKQGLYPFRAPIGYLDQGGGKEKAIDPIKGPMIRNLFESYGTGEYSLRELRTMAHKKGLTNHDGRKLSLSGLTAIMHNPFYYGVIYIKRHGESYPGIHKPIISQELFDQVQYLMKNKTIQGSSKHEHLFRRMFNCISCSRSLIAERQKGHVYYRCHLCSGVSVREDVINQQIENFMQYCVLTEEEIEIIEEAKQTLINKGSNEKEKVVKVLNLDLGNLKQRLSTLTDKLLDETIDKDTYLEKKNQIAEQIQTTKEKLAKTIQGMTEKIERKVNALELYKSFNLSYQNGMNNRKRQLLKLVTSNRTVHQKNIVIELQKPFHELCEIKKLLCGPPDQGRSRTFEDKLQEWVQDNRTDDDLQSP